MKNILITGGAGKIGFDLVNRLVETNANITILDLESRASIKKLESVKDRVRVVYGDVEDADLVRDLVKRNDIVVDYAGIMPPLADVNEGIANATNYNGTKNIVDAIKELNPECVYIYMSFLCVYGETNKKVRKLSIGVESTYPDDYYSVSIVRSEDYIKSNLKKYSIFRMPIVLTKNNYYIKHMKLDRTMDFITKEDLNAIVIGVMNSDKIYGKIYNISGFKAKGREVVERLYKVTGKLSILNRNIYFGEYEDSSVIEKVCKINYTTLDEFVEDLKRETSPMKRTVLKIINVIKYAIFKKLK